MKFKVYFFSFFFILILLLYSFQKKQNTTIETITGRYVHRYEQFKEAIGSFHKTVNSVPFNASNAKVIKTEYLKLRSAFKSWEYLGEYMDPIFIKEYINGAPLQKLENNSFAANIIEPKGLQAIDEVLFSDELLKSKYYILEKLAEMSRTLADYSLVKIYDRDVFIASRQGLIRLYTLGVTGFDTPGSLNGLTDSKSVIHSIYEDISLYLPLVENKNLSDSTNTLFKETIKYLDYHPDFNKFDRLTFLTKYINPLYRNLYRIHVSLNYEMPHEISGTPQPVNYSATNLFDADFLKAKYYNRVPDVYDTKLTTELGRILFYDPILSGNNERACKSCHNPEKGFTDQLPSSMAYGNKGFLKRNSPTLLNSVYSEKYFHDMRARSFEDQMEHVITSSDEFNTSFFEILDKINSSQEYKEIFKNTFHYTDTSITIKYIQFALSSYVTSLNSLNSPFDKYVRGEHKELSQSAKNGYNLFMGKAACGTCHYAPIFNGTVPPYYKESESEVLGVPKDPYAKNLILDPDLGRGNSLLKERVEFYNYSFKTPTVRNIDLSFPYMHNGSFKTLEDLMDFYNDGGGKGKNIDVPTQTLSDGKLNLSKKEISDIITFMKTLTDTVHLTHKPISLPAFKTNQKLNSRKIGGNY